jgi:transcription elongation factor GreA
MQSSDLILTASSKRKLEDELFRLRSVERPKIGEEIRKAREYGDLSENFEYHSARQSQAFMNGRIAEIEAILDRAKVVDDNASSDLTEVGLGTTVTIRDTETDEDWTLTIVDATSANPDIDLISYASPIGQKLMKKKIGEMVDIVLPEGKVRYEVVELKRE